MSLIIACQEKHSSRKINTKKMEIRENTFSLLWFQKYLGHKTLPYPRLIRAKMGRESLDEMSCTTLPHRKLSTQIVPKPVRL